MYELIYYPELNKITEHPLASILLKRIVDLYFASKYKPFFKFRAPCKHELYREGESWTEELGFSRKDFDTALKRIAQRQKDPEKRIMTTFVYYWTDLTNLTWYEPNLATIYDALYDREAS
jgi:hypothetical protein